LATCDGPGTIGGAQPFGLTVVHLLSVQFVCPPPVMQVCVVHVVCAPICTQLVCVSPVTGGFAGPGEADGDRELPDPGPGDGCEDFVCGGNGHQSLMVIFGCGPAGWCVDSAGAGSGGDGDDGCDG
jgi:hypothetical protein